MYDMICDLITYFGFTSVPENFSDFLLWFVAVVFGVEFVLYIIDSIFYTIRTLSRGCR